MIETVTAYRARPKCDRCGWAGPWRLSRSADTAKAKAAADLAGHAVVWHSSP